MAQRLQSAPFQGAPDPNLANMMRYGGTGGPGNQAMSLMAQFGTPGPRGAANMEQFGVASEGSGRPLADLAYGRSTGAAQYLTPFLNQQRNPYMPPPIPQRDVRLR